MNKNILALVFSVTGLLSALTAHSAGVDLKPIKEVFEPISPQNPEKYVKVAVVQWAPPTAPLKVTKDQAESIKQKNRESLAKWAGEAVSKGAKWVVTSEMGVVGYPYHPDVPPAEDNFLTREEILPYAETVPGPTTQFLGTITKQLGIYLQVGYVEIDLSTQKLYNVAVLIGPDGNLKLKHRKWNLYQVESKYFTAGNEFNFYNSEMGKYFLMVCADIYDSKLLSRVKASKVQVVGLTTSWAQMNTGINYFKRGAVNSGAFVLAANQPYYPDSGVINPDGTLQSHIRQTEGVAYGYIPLYTNQKNFDLNQEQEQEQDQDQDHKSN